VTLRITGWQFWLPQYGHIVSLPGALGKEGCSSAFGPGESLFIGSAGLSNGFPHPRQNLAVSGLDVPQCLHFIFAPLFIK